MSSTPVSVEDLSDVWLWQALAQLVQVVRRYCRGQPEGGDGGKERAPFGVAYFMVRLTGARLSVMFSALAAEAYINRILHNRLSGGDLKTAMNIRPPAEKFAAGTRLALGQTLFPRDEDIYERL
jgi:hypothetical protein